MIFALSPKAYCYPCRPSRQEYAAAYTLAAGWTALQARRAGSWVFHFHKIPESGTSAALVFYFRKLRRATLLRAITLASLDSCVYVLPEWTKRKSWKKVELVLSVVASIVMHLIPRSRKNRMLCPTCGSWMHESCCLCHDCWLNVI